jgi:uncharacterized protein involved in exopolysaccharide biosynthesis
LRRYIESALRLRVRIIIAALLVFGAAVVALSFTKGGFTSSATVWVEKPPSTSTIIQDPSNINAYISAATFVNSILDQLLGTQQFKLQIAQKAGIPIRNSAEQARVIDDLQRNLRSEAAGANLVRIIYTGDKPTYAQQIISQTIETFVVYQNKSRVSQINATLGLYQSQLTSAQEQVNKSREALNDYIRNHPGVGGNNSVPDPTYTDLQQQFSSDLEQVSSLKDRIGQLITQREAPASLNTNFLTVIDEPSKPEPYKASIKDLIRNVGLALALAMIAAVGLTLVGTWTDMAVYTLNDISSLALTDPDGNARELLVGLVPYVPSLGAIRRREAKQGKGRRAQQTAASATGRAASTIAASGTRR